MTSKPNHILPSSPYGITNTRFADIDDPSVPLPERNVMEAANRLNDYRYRKLSEKQRVFVDVYLSSGFNAAEAAKRSGYCSDVVVDHRYEKRCGAIGRGLAKNKAIALGIQLAVDYHFEKEKIPGSRVINEIAALAFSNIADFYVNDGTGDPRLEMPADHERKKLAAVSEITIDSYEEGRGDNKREVKRVKVKMYDKLSALEKLARIKAAQGDPDFVGITHEQNGNGTVNVFNILPINSGEFLPAPKVPEEKFKVPVYQEQAPVEPPTLLASASPVNVRTILPNTTQEPVQWSQPEKAQRRPLTIEHE